MKKSIQLLHLKDILPAGMRTGEEYPAVTSLLILSACIGRAFRRGDMSGTCFCNPGVKRLQEQ